MFVYIRSAAFVIVTQKCHSKVYGNPIAPSFNSILLDIDQDGTQKSLAGYKIQDSTVFCGWAGTNKSTTYQLL